MESTCTGFQNSSVFIQDGANWTIPGGGAPVAPGLYFARLRTDAGTANATVVRVK